MENYIEQELKMLLDDKSMYFSNIVGIFNNPNPLNHNYVEKHHIIPRAFNKDLVKDKNNLISVSAFNHIMLHYYYYKCAKDDGVKHKLRVMLLFVCKENSSKQRISSITEEEMVLIAEKVAKVRETQTHETLEQKKDKKTTKPFICLNTGEVFTNINYCMEKYGLSNLNPVLKGKLKTCSGYYFIFADDPRLKDFTYDEIINQINNSISESRSEKRKKSYTNEWKTKLSRSHGGKEILCLETDEIFSTQAECCEKLNLNKGLVCKALKTRLHPRNWEYHLIYKEDKGLLSNEELIEQIVSYSLENNGNVHRYNAKKVICVEKNIEYSSASEAIRITGIKGINQVCLGKSKTAGGYHWIYKEVA